MIAALNLTLNEMVLLAFITLAAGMVRGFSGFALSALVMASATLFLAPVELIPICWWLEMAASLMMVRGGWQDADRTVVLGLVIGSMLGVPLGLLLTTNLPVEASKLLALSVIVVLAMSQLARIRLAFLATRVGLYVSGVSAGIITGLAGVGGMIVALYVLSQDRPAKQMRASLVLFLFAGSLTSMVTLLLFGVMTLEATARGLVFAVPTALGVMLGKAMFTERFAPYYRPFCLILLISLAGLGVIRTVVT